jgi:hypothetical protein
VAITYPLAVPSERHFRRFTVKQRVAIGMSASPMTFAQQMYVHQGAVWGADVELKPMRKDEAEAWCSFLSALNGMEGTFLMGVPLGPTAPGGSPTVSGASQTGRTLVTAGWSASVTILAGTYIQLGSGATTLLHKVVQDVTASGGGAATLDIWPRLRSSPANGASIGVTAPKGRWRLASNENSWDLGLAQIYGISFGAIEAL